jgi:hypothetical protein
MLKKSEFRFKKVSLSRRSFMFAFIWLLYIAIILPTKKAVFRKKMAIPGTDQGLHM